MPVPGVVAVNEDSNTSTGNVKDDLVRFEKVFYHVMFISEVQATSEIRDT